MTMVSVLMKTLKIIHVDVIQKIVVDILLKQASRWRIKKSLRLSK